VIPSWLASDAGYVDLQQVPASERAALRHPMTDAERQAFGDRIERVAGQYRDMPPDLIEHELDLLDGDQTR
jgi:hypothetical protein